MPVTEQWKPCDALTPDDFLRHPIWGFDLFRESAPGTDETWVRPHRFAAPPTSSDVLFVAATIRFSNGETVPGAIAFRFIEHVPRVEDVLLLSPRYLPTSAMGRGPPMLQAIVERRMMAALRRPTQEIYPLAYEGRVPIGAGLELRGTIGGGSAT